MFILDLKSVTEGEMWLCDLCILVLAINLSGHDHTVVPSCVWRIQYLSRSTWAQHFVVSGIHSPLPSCRILSSYFTCFTRLSVGWIYLHYLQRLKVSSFFPDWTGLCRICLQLRGRWQLLLWWRGYHIRLPTATSSPNDKDTRQRISWFERLCQYCDTCNYADCHSHAFCCISSYRFLPQSWSKSVDFDKPFDQFYGTVPSHCAGYYAFYRVSNTWIYASLWSIQDA